MSSRVQHLSYDCSQRLGSCIIDIYPLFENVEYSCTQYKGNSFTNRKGIFSRWSTLILAIVQIILIFSHRQIVLHMHMFSYVPPQKDVLFRMYRYVFCLFALYYLYIIYSLHTNVVLLAWSLTEVIMCYISCIFLVNISGL